VYAFIKCKSGIHGQKINIKTITAKIQKIMKTGYWPSSPSIRLASGEISQKSALSPIDMESAIGN
jgi:hypothetical protein